MSACYSQEGIVPQLPRPLEGRLAVSRGSTCQEGIVPQLAVSRGSTCMSVLLYVGG